MVHQYKLNGYNIVLDSCSGSIHAVDEVAYDIIEKFQQESPEEIVRELLVKYAGREDVTEEELYACIADVAALEKAGKLFTPDTFADMAGTFKERSGAKDHGRQNQIEGRLEPGQKVVVVEDLISTGGSCIEVVEALREAGAEVLGIVSIFTYGLQKGIDRMAAANVVNYSLSNFDAVCEVAAEEVKIKPEDIDRLKKFRANPSDESWIG